MAWIVNDMDKEKLTIEDIFTALTLSKSLLHKSLITFILSSGFKNQYIKELKISDLLTACEPSFKEQIAINEFETLLSGSNLKFDSKPKDNTFNLETLLQMDPMKIMPYWIMPKQERITFNTPEAMYYLFLYLKDRNNHEKIENDDYLFELYGKNYNNDGNIKSGQLKTDYISKHFNNAINERLHEIVDTKASFNVSNLIEYYRDVCDKHLQCSQKQDAFDLLIGKAKKKIIICRIKG